MTTEKLPILSGRKVCKALSQLGYYKARQKSSHIILKKKLNPEGHRTVVVPNHKEVEKGTLKEILNRVELTIPEFLELL